MITPLTPSHAPASSSSEDDAIRAQAGKAAEKFEAHMITQMLRQMRRSMRELADEDSPLKNKVNDDMLDLADGLLGDQLASQRAFGIADALLRQLLPTAPEVPPQPPA
ncbi:hypothetical protein V4F39_16905 [Aquincola sp. MAHUQ-54]|uniref:Flagellar protein FlgJ n=1 Tax=Aquincola agrisoli TaxID=3119538 RepID=A0AAW9Q729_9BURK